LSLATIFVIVLIIFLLGGFRGRSGGYGYGHGGNGLIGTLRLIVVVMPLTGPSDAHLLSCDLRISQCQHVYLKKAVGGAVLVMTPIKLDFQAQTADQSRE
jgi:hypothetical protein